MEDNTAPDTSNFLDWVEIKNFKSIKDLRLDCKRVNIFIGKPNVGKSNILEALGMLGNPSATESEKLLNGSVRYESIKHLFYDADVTQRIEVHTPNRTVLLSSDYLEDLNKRSYEFVYGRSDNSKITLFENGKTGSMQIRKALNSPVKKYDFNNLLKFPNPRSKPLAPPHGDNLYEVIYRDKALWDEFAKLFDSQGLEFVLDTAEENFVLQKKIGHLAYQYPYFSIADTFRRFMFYIAAIESNKNSVLVLEEPEVHSFPPYTHELAERMILIYENQYFTSTHSPYLLHTFIEKIPNEDLNVFITYYEGYETKVRALAPEELKHIFDFGTDVFFNLDKFIPNGGRPVSV